MEDKELKKELDKIPDADEHGEPIYKIDGQPEEALFHRNKPDVPHGNAQDEKDETSQE